VTLRDLLTRTFWALSVRPGRAILSGLGVAVGVGAIVGVLGVSATIQNGLLGQLNGLGDVLTVSGTSSSTGAASLMAPRSVAMIRRIPTVQAVAGTFTLPSSVQRTQFVPGQSGIPIVAFTGPIASATGTRVIAGEEISSRLGLPEAMLGYQAAQALGIGGAQLPTRVWVNNEYVTVVGILSPTPTQTSTEFSLFIPEAYARHSMGYGGSVDNISVRVPLSYASTVAGLLVPTIDPSGTLGLQVQEDSSVLLAAADAATAFQGLFLALSVVAVLVSGLGVMNTLLVAVVERRAEIGIRRALGATRAGIAAMFVSEAVMVALTGSVAGILLGLWVTIIGALHQRVAPDLPVPVALVGVGIALVVACLASLYPAARAASLPPSEALRMMA
jgi:putative ABC transport system permease protein